ncbi:MAG: hypothetical protein RIQ54_617, partial [Candidatus Parcubacteria bacterium]
NLYLLFYKNEGVAKLPRNYSDQTTVGLVELRVKESYKWQPFGSSFLREM